MKSWMWISVLLMIMEHTLGKKIFRDARKGSGYSDYDDEEMSQNRLDDIESSMYEIENGR